MRTMITSLLLTLLLTLPAAAGELGDITMPDNLEQEGTALVLNGMGQRSVVWIDVYVAGLYLTEKTTDAQTAIDMPGSKRMVMVFQRDVDGEDICDAWTEGFEKNAPGGADAFQDKLAMLCADTPEETKDGQTVTYAYSAAENTTTYEIDGQTMGQYVGADFFNGLLSCWVGPKPGPGKSFKKGVLGLK